uniref:Amine oxidase domain-containing protein n=1 Tax=Oryza glaberrima TaxID=4538 RepID=I1QAP3_ORYGL
MTRVAVVGAGVSGLAAAHEAARGGGGVRVTLYEREDSLGGHARTVAVDGDAGPVDLDLGFMVFNREDPNEHDIQILFPISLFLTILHSKWPLIFSILPH